MGRKTGDQSEQPQAAKPPKTAEPARDERAERLARALRENLRRRKAAAKLERPPS